MSGTVSGFGAASDYGLLGVLVANETTVRQKLDTLTNQVSTGKIAQTYAGLGSGARVSLDLNPAVAHQEAWSNGIDQAVGQMQVAQTAMTSIQSIASDLYAKLDDLNGLSPTEVDTIAADARDSLRQVAGLLDTKDGDNYVFAGQDSGNPPVPNPDDVLSSGFYTQIAAAVGQLGANGASATAAATLATASSNAAGTSPFSAALSQPAAALSAQRSVVPIGEANRRSSGCWPVPMRALPRPGLRQPARICAISCVRWRRSARSAAVR
jgi:flagellar hook-associated protein 3 FlgL